MAENLQFVVTGLALGAVYALVGLGIVLVYQVTGVINFAQGEFVMLGALTFALLEQQRWSPPAAAVVGIAVAGAAGLAVERAVIAPVRRAATERLIILTIGASIAIRGLVLLAVGTDPHFAREFSRGQPLRLAGVVVAAQYVWVVGVAAAAVFALWLFMTKTTTGLAMRACAMNSEAARLMTISPGRMSLIAFGAAAMIGGIGGVVLAPLQAPDYLIGLGLGLGGFTAAVIGGLDSPVGAVVGGLLLGVGQSVAAGHLPSGYKDVLAYAILLVVLLARPQGLLRPLSGARV